MHPTNATLGTPNTMPLTEMAAVTQAITHYATGLGLTKVGFVALPPLQSDDKAPGMAHADEHLQNWLAKQYHADMDWMQTHATLRTNPRGLLPAANSIICVALNYYHPMAVPKNGPKISRYARGKDYHKVLKKKLKKLGQWIEQQWPGTLCRPITDSAPAMEKPLAVQAGLGWQGKHSLLITPEVGSWVFLGELLVSLPLVPSQPFTTDLCGKCKRCIDVCPTDAIVSPGVVDSNRCISYWTIERKTPEIPTPIAEKLNGWVFGCDICQEVCPINLMLQVPTLDEKLQPLPHNAPQVLETELASLTPEEFTQRYQGTPVMRAGYEKLMANIAALKG